MKNEYTVTDKLDHLTVLYHKGCKQGFKFFGDDPEEHKTYITDKQLDVAKKKFPNYRDFPYEFIYRFYAHSRCLVFTEGVWMSETAAYPQFLRYKPESYCNFRVSGLTRFTALTDNASAICVGIDPDMDTIPCYGRLVHTFNAGDVYQPKIDSYLIPTVDCSIGKEGSIIKAVLNKTVRFTKRGQLIEYTPDPFNMEESVLDYAKLWLSNRIEVFDRD